ncbi:tryptophan-rich sensory protein [Candidatus Roizmanbacteria bacterium]|nr:tryptophan-rich sensory protein [Candidatus Roizmanbacteria bacterium]
MENTLTWYQTIEKPFFAPPGWVFGIAWSILYPIIFVSFGYVLFQAVKKKIPAYVTIPFIINLVSNFLYSPLQFGARNYTAATLDILVVLVSLIYAMKYIRRYSKWVFYAQIPYFLWVAFATVLQFSITLLNK